MKPRKPTAKRATSTRSKKAAKSNGAAPARRTAPARTWIDAPPEHCFWVNRGPILKNLPELRAALADGMTDEQFGHHVTNERNDFANWVEAVLGDVKCARALRKAGSRRAARRAVETIMGASK